MIDNEHMLCDVKRGVAGRDGCWVYPRTGNRAGKTRMAERQGAKWNKSVDVVQLRRGGGIQYGIWYLPVHRQRSTGKGP